MKKLMIIAALLASSCTLPDGQVIPPIIEPTPVPTPAPVITPPPVTPDPRPISMQGWKYGPLHVGGYAWTSVNQGTNCCRGIIFVVIAGPKMSSDAQPVPMWQLRFFSDVTGNFPLDNAWAANQENWWQEKDIIGLAPDLTQAHSPMWNKELIARGAKVRAVKDCPSIFENSETIRNNIPQQGVKKGEVFQYVSWGYWMSDVATVQTDDRSRTPYVLTTCLEVL